VTPDGFMTGVAEADEVPEMVYAQVGYIPRPTANWHEKWDVWASALSISMTACPKSDFDPACPCRAPGEAAAWVTVGTVRFAHSLFLHAAYTPN
jgi:hypothetical protein